jgi:hypothetical protein
MFEIEKIQFKCSDGISMEFDVEEDTVTIKNRATTIRINFADLRDVVEYINDTPLVED